MSLACNNNYFIALKPLTLVLHHTERSEARNYSLVAILVHQALCYSGLCVVDNYFAYICQRMSCVTQALYYTAFLKLSYLLSVVRPIHSSPSASCTSSTAVSPSYPAPRTPSITICNSLFNITSPLITIQ